MGISDEDYTRAIQEHRIKQLELVLKRKEEEAKMSGTIHINQGGTTTTYKPNLSTGTFTPVGLKTITEGDLHHDAMKAPLSALIDMWTVRWSGEWVNEAEFDEDDFWRLALVRLLGANKLEKHNLANQYRSVYRIIE